MEKINALGKPCPIPVIETKKIIQKVAQSGGVIKILVDNEVACQNIEKMSKGMGLKNYYEKISVNEYEVTVEVPENFEKENRSANDQELVIVFSKKTLGEGEKELGEILLKSYIYSLTELDTPPEHLLFFNEGAFLTNQNSGVLKDLQTLHQKGTQISTCGTCLDFYGIKDQLAIGEITNMYGIAETMAQAQKVLNF